jgi:hypothetical protein
MGRWWDTGTQPRSSDTQVKSPSICHHVDGYEWGRVPSHLCLRDCQHPLLWLHPRISQSGPSCLCLFSLPWGACLGRSHKEGVHRKDLPSASLPSGVQPSGQNLLLSHHTVYLSRQEEGRSLRSRAMILRCLSPSPLTVEGRGKPP